MESGFFACYQSSCSQFGANVQVSGQKSSRFRVIYQSVNNKGTHVQSLAPVKYTRELFDRPVGWENVLKDPPTKCRQFPCGLMRIG